MVKENLLEFDPLFKECKKTLNSLKKNYKGFTVIEEKHYKDIKRLDENLNKIYSIFEKLAKYKDTEKEYNAKLQYLVKATQEAIFINKDGICLETNQAAVDMFGYDSIEEMIGIFGTDVIAPESRELVKNRMLNNIPGTYEAIGLRKDGTKFPVQIKAKRMLYKGESIRATAIRDISDLKEAEQKLRHFTSFVQDGIIQLDHDGNITFWNNAAERIFGYSKNEVLGNNFHVFSIIPKHYHDKVREGYLKFKKIGRGKIIDKIIEANGLKKDGTEFPAELSISALKIKNKFNSIAIVRDISKRKRAEKKLQESEEKFRTLYEKSPNALFIYNKKGILLDCNLATEKIFGLRKDELIGKKYFDLVVLNTDQELLKGKKYENVVKRRDLSQGELIIRRKNGSIAWLYYQSSIIKLNNEILIEVIGQDITEKKNTEYKLRESENKYRKAYDRANFYKELFAHDINNILNNVLSSVQLYDFYRNNPEKAKNFNVLMNVIRESAYRGANLISNVRKLSQLEEIGISLEPIEVCGVLNDALNFTFKSFQEKKINIRFDSQKKEFFVQANELLLDVFENILINAVKYNESIPVEILIKISPIKNKEKDYIKIEFLDNGIGISNTKKKIIFHRGYTKKKNTKGMGFGLSLVKTVMDNYNGKIWVEDKVQGMYTKGSNFILLIPEADNN